jgi:hypothetical protein
MKTSILVAALLLFSLTLAAQMPVPGMMRMMQNCPMVGMTDSFDVKYEATPTGATLVFTPKDPAKLKELQTKISEMAERMNKMSNSEGRHDEVHPGK